MQEYQKFAKDKMGWTFEQMARTTEQGLKKAVEEYKQSERTNKIVPLRIFDTITNTSQSQNTNANQNTNTNQNQNINSFRNLADHPITPLNTPMHTNNNADNISHVSTDQLVQRIVNTNKQFQIKKDFLRTKNGTLSTAARSALETSIHADLDTLRNLKQQLSSMYNMLNNQINAERELLAIFETCQNSQDQTFATEAKQRIEILMGQLQVLKQVQEL